ncbi:MAG TPA: HAD hydrolase-like protein [Longimicrobium sp.]|nr:HAD hydrolase-like protein [Longimicrobium sp.]
MKYRLAIFDFDGTLSDSFPWFMRTVNDVADRYRFRRIDPADLERLRGMHAREIVAHLGVPFWKLPLVARHMRARMAVDMEGIRLFPGAERMLERLAEGGIALAIVTSNSEANVRRVLGPRAAARIAHYACGASLFGKRPLLRRVLRAAGVPASAAVSIGDELRDLHAARAERIAFGAVTWGFTAPESLRAHHPEEVFETMEDVVDTLLSSSSRRVAGEG